MSTRRELLAAALAGLVVASARAGPPPHLRLMEEAEALLAAGDGAAALAAFEQAAAMVHEPEVEMGMVRSHMQAGDYRRALAFCAHAAGAHRDAPAGTALYVWLLHIGGQGGVATRVLAEALALDAQDASLLAVRDALAQAWPRAQGVLLAPPQRMAPYATSATPEGRAPAASRVAGTAVLAADGQHAWAPSATLAGARQVWLRNGLGQTVMARVEASAEPSPLAMLSLAAALPVQGQMSLREPFAGSPASLVEYAGNPLPQPAWPVLRQGFFGRVLLAPGDRLLGIEAPTGPRGGPVFDAHGRLAGVACPGADGRDRLIGIKEMGLWGASQPAAVPAPASSPVAVGPDVVYETALRVALQVLVRG